MRAITSASVYPAGFLAPSVVSTQGHPSAFANWMVLRVYGMPRYCPSGVDMG